MVANAACFPTTLASSLPAPLACAGNTIIRIYPRPNTFLVVSLHLLHFTFPMSELGHSNSVFESSRDIFIRFHFPEIW
jgi:hypothetical protein